MTQPLADRPAHDVDEPSGDADYRRCFECGHVYHTPADLRRAYRAACWDAVVNDSFNRWGWLITWLLTPRASRIRFCQHCLHDF